MSAAEGTSSTTQAQLGAATTTPEAPAGLPSLPASFDETSSQPLAASEASGAQILSQTEAAPSSATLSRALPSSSSSSSSASATKRKPGRPSIKSTSTSATPWPAGQPLPEGTKLAKDGSIYVNWTDGTAYRELLSWMNSGVVDHGTLVNLFRDRFGIKLEKNNLRGRIYALRKVAK